MDILKTLPDESVHACITSPPYWGLRDYGIEPQIWDGDPTCQHVWGDETVRPGKPDRNTEGKDRNGNGLFGTVAPRGSQPCKSARGAELHTGSFCIKCSAWRGSFGLEPFYELYVKHAVDIFQEIRRVLRKDGTLWLNMGDTYAGYRGDKYAHKPFGRDKAHDGSTPPSRPSFDFKSSQIKPKDMFGMPWRLAFALQADGWYLRQDIIWHKLQAMPESVKDRCTKAHEYVFLLSKSKRYYYNQNAIKEPASADTHARYARGRSDDHKYADGGPGNQTIARTMAHMRKPGVNPKAAANPVRGWQSGPGAHSAIDHNQDRNEATKYPQPKQNSSFSSAVKDIVEHRNKRSVWSISPEPFPGSHFATFPQKLIRPMVLAGAPPHGVVLDPFMGAGTTAIVALREGRHFVGVELNPSYIEMAWRRIEQSVGLLFLNKEVCHAR